MAKVELSSGTTGFEGHGVVLCWSLKILRSCSSCLCVLSRAFRCASNALDKNRNCDVHWE